MKQKILITNLQWNVYQLEGRIVNQISGVIGLTVLVTQLLAPVSCVCVWHKLQMPENLWAPGTEGVMQSSMKFLPWQVQKRFSYNILNFSKFISFAIFVTGVGSLHEQAELNNELVKLR